MIALLIAGAGVILAGLAAIGFGIPVKEFGFGNTLILTGSVGVCTGLVMISLGLVVREMRKLAANLAAAEPRAAAPLPRRELKLPPASQDIDDDAEDAPAFPPFARDTLPPPAPPAQTGPEAGVPPWQDEVLRDRERLAAAASAAEEPKRRNLMFTSTRRDREKERTDAVAQALELDLTGPAPDQASEEAPHVDDTPQTEGAPRFEDAWPRGDRPSPAPDRPRFSDAIRQAARASTGQPERFNDRLPDPSEIPDRDEPASAPPPARARGVTVLKSGVVDGMAYSLYSDGSIEAQMPEGLMRFASIDELREHLENRG